ncbi:unnamed protein product [Acanthosepion pharaonis]|uniref:Uncharacterized protein n=1 Tax=Acanthosepion pharaonis TaxID=158019 RepID=A0A812C3D6_ACAPH|nr:unnamed protein product [Sepia pharaonis]
MLQRRLHVPALFLQGCKIPFNNKWFPTSCPNSFKADGNASKTTSCPALFLQGCEDSFQQPNNNASETTSCPQLYSFKAVEDSFQQQMVMLQRRLHVPALFLFQGCEDSFQQQIIMLRTTSCPSFIPSRLLSHSLFLQGCEKIPFSNQIIMLQNDFMSQLYSFKAVEDSFQQPNNNASETTSCQALFLQGCEDSFQQPNGNASETTSCPALFLQGCEDSFQQPNNNASEHVQLFPSTKCFIPSKAVEDSLPTANNASERLVSQLLFLQGCENSFQQPNGNASGRLHVSFIPSKAVEDSFQQPNGNASRDDHVPALFLQAGFSATKY